MRHEGAPHQPHGVMHSRRDELFCELRNDTAGHEQVVKGEGRETAESTKQAVHDALGQ